MCSYNRVNGEFACEDSYLLTDVLKKDFNFKGFLLYDYRLTVYDDVSDSWKLIAGSYVVCVGDSSQNLPSQQTVSF